MFYGILLHSPSLSPLFLLLYCCWLKTTKTCIVGHSIVPLLYCVTVTLYLRDIRIYLWSNICATKNFTKLLLLLSNKQSNNKFWKKKNFGWEYKKKNSTYLLLTLSQLVYAMFFGMVVDIRVYIRIRMIRFTIVAWMLCKCVQKSNKLTNKKKKAKKKQK